MTNRSMACGRFWCDAAFVLDFFAGQADRPSAPNRICVTKPASTTVRGNGNLDIVALVVTLLSVLPVNHRAARATVARRDEPVQENIFVAKATFAKFQIDQVSETQN